jgi:hypothetical protein
MAQYTEKYRFKKPGEDEFYNVNDQNENWDKNEEALKAIEIDLEGIDVPGTQIIVDQSKAPVSPGNGTIANLISWISNRLKAITGKANWWESPTKSLEELNTDKVDKVAGKGLSTNDYTTAEKQKLAGLSNYSHPTEHPASMIKMEDGTTVENKVSEHLNDMPTQEATLNEGLNVLAAPMASMARFKFYGRHFVNLLGRDGNFEIDSNGDGVADGWLNTRLFGATASLSASGVKYGAKAQRITSTASDTSISRRIERSDIQVVAGKYYVLLADASTDGTAVATINVESNTATGVSKASSPSSANKPHYVRFAPTASGTIYIRLYNQIPVGQVGWTQYDGARLYEITQEEYNILHTMTDDEIAAKYPYVDSVQPLRNPYVIKKGKNLVDYLSAYKDFLILQPDGSYLLDYLKATSVKLPVVYKDNTQYTLSYTCRIAEAGTYNVRYRIEYTDGTVTDCALATTSWATVKHTSTLGKTVKSIFLNYNVGGGQFYIKDIQLEVGTTATQRESFNEDYLVFECDAYDGETIEVVNGQYVKTKKWDRKVFSGSETESWSDSGVSNAGYITFHAAIPDIGESVSSDNFPQNTLTTDANYNGEGISCSTTYRVIYIRIAKSKLTTPDAAGFKRWLQSNHTTVHYQLATPTTEVVKVEGAIGLHRGQNQIEAGSGMLSKGVISAEKYKYTASLKPVTMYYKGNLKEAVDDLVEKVVDVATEVSNKVEKDVVGKGILNTSEKTLIGAINEVLQTANAAFQSANDGRTVVANAVAGKGVSASPTDTFSTLAAKIGTIASVKSIQSGFASHTVNGSMTIPINTVKASKSIVMIHFAGSSTSGQLNMIQAKVLDNNTLQFTRGGGTDRIDFTWQVIEFADTCVVQKGDYSYASGQATSINIPIVSVNLSKSFVVQTQWGGTSDAYGGQVFAYLSSPTNLNIGRIYAGSGTVNTHWQVVEIK